MFSTTSLAVISSFVDQTVQLIDPTPVLAFNPPGVIPGVTFLAEAGISRNDELTYTYDDAPAVPVPERATFALLGIGLAVIGISSRKRPKN